MNNKYMKIALKLANKAYLNGDVPIGAVIVKNDRIIGRGYNQREKKKNVIKHAEIIAIEQACKKCNNWYLTDCEIYITLEPCMMCLGAILQSHINTIIYSNSSPKYGYINKVESSKIEIIKYNKYEKECMILLQNFFKNKRKNSKLSD